MASAQQLTPPSAGDDLVARSGSSVHSIDPEEDKFATPPEENPLETVSNAPPARQTSSDLAIEQSILTSLQLHRDFDPDEPPPPYEEPTSITEDFAIGDAPQIAPVEYSCENSPQLVFAPGSDSSSPLIPPPRNPARLSNGSSLPEVSPVQPAGSPAISQEPWLMPAPLHVRSRSSEAPILRRPVPSPSASSSSVRGFSSAKAREAGFEIQPPTPHRTESSSSNPSIVVLSSHEPLRHVRQPGKLTAYLIPFPKPRLKGVRVEDIPNRFLVYTPPLPPLSKPAPGEKETHWHKTRRTWQEDVRKATMSNASKATWKGIKAKSTVLVGKGVNLTRTSNVEFLDRAAEGAITSTADEVEEELAEEENADDARTNSSAASPRPSVASNPSSLETPKTPRRQSSITSKSSEPIPPPKNLEELTLIFPPSLDLSPEQIRSEFVEGLTRTREKSRKEAVVASSLVPLAAAIDASLLVTFGGLTEVSGVWAYTSIRGASTSKKMAKGLALGEEQAAFSADQSNNTEPKGCTCGHHEDEYGHLEAITAAKKGKSKRTKTGINLRMQQSTHIEILRRYLDICCLKREFNMFPTIEESAGDVNEQAVLEAIGWSPTRRAGRDLEIEGKDHKVVERLSPEEDEAWQTREAREDVKRILKKGAAEWVAWCKGFQKDPEGALKR